MLHKTRGIIINTIKYSDTSVIAKIYTEQFGLRSYLVRGARGNRKSKTKSSQLQHLSLLDLVVYEKENNQLQNLRETETAYQFSSIPFDVIKGTMVLFLNEVLYKSLHEEGSNPELFGFLFDSLVKFDQLEDSFQDFHLGFLMGLSKFLGFYPRNNYSENNHYFDLQEGVFVSKKPLHNNFLNTNLAAKLNYMLKLNHLEGRIFDNTTERNQFMEKLLEFYRLHIPGFGELKSHKVLREVLG
jgi:DNA repair protein RecO (recombination protein O)